MRYVTLLLLLACTRTPTPRTAYCEAAQRRAAQCGIRFPVPNNCLNQDRVIGDPDEMSCQEIEEEVNKRGYLW